jgi:hypothetical protein
MASPPSAQRLPKGTFFVEEQLQCKPEAHTFLTYSSFINQVVLDVKQQQWHWKNTHFP